MNNSLEMIKRQPVWVKLAALAIITGSVVLAVGWPGAALILAEILVAVTKLLKAIVELLNALNKL